MRKTFLKVSLLAVLGLGMSASFTSCKDYDSEIDNLQNQINQMKTDLDAIKSLVNSGSVITNVSQNGEGVTFTLSNGQTYTVKNGAKGENGTPGKDADVWSIITNDKGEYVWAKNGVATDIAAQGPAGKDGANGTTLPGVYYIPNEETGNFDKVDPSTTPATVTPTDITWRPKGGLTAVATNDKVILSNLKDAEGNPMEDITIWRSMFVKSLVAVPGFYLDGIEATQYGVIDGVTYTTKNVTANAGTPVATGASGVPASGAVIAKGSPSYYEVVKSNGNPVKFQANEKATMAYHLNPSNAVVEGMNFNLLIDDKTVINRGSDVSGEVLEVSPVNGNGDITMTYQLKGTNWLAPYNWNEVGEDDDDYDADYVNGKWTMLALQVANPQNDSALVASNNVVVVKKSIELCQLLASQGTNLTADNCFPTYVNATLAIQEATANTPAVGHNTNDIKVVTAGYNEVLPLGQHIAIETSSIVNMLGGKDNNQNILGSETLTEGIMTLADAAAKYDLTPSYKLVTYTVNPNKTSEDQFAQINATTGDITPCWVNGDGAQMPIPGTTTGRSAIGRKPLVYVTLNNAAGKIVLAGFVKIEWTEPAQVLPSISLSNNNFGYLCKNTVASTWEQITGYVYEAIKVTPEYFSNHYIAEATKISETDSIINIYVAPGVTDAQEIKNKFNKTVTANFLGTFKWDTNVDGTHTQALTFTITNDQYKTWYPYLDGDGNLQYNVTTSNVTKTVYVKFVNKVENKTVYVGFDITLAGKPTVEYSGKLLSQWSADEQVAPINPAVPGQPNAAIEAITELPNAAAMAMDFQSIWIGGFPKVTVPAPYNFTNDKLATFASLENVNYKFVAQDPKTVTGLSGQVYNLIPSSDGATLFGYYTDANGGFHFEPIAVINPDTDANKDIISILPKYGTNFTTYGSATALNNAINAGTVGKGGKLPNTGTLKNAKIAQDIVNAQAFNKQAPAITFDVALTATYGQKDQTCVLPIANSFALEVGIGRPIELTNTNTGMLQDANNVTTPLSKLFGMNDWQGHALWSVSKSGNVTPGKFNSIDNLFNFWFSIGSDYGFINGAVSGDNYGIIIDLANALVGSDPDVEKNMGKFNAVYVDKKLTLTDGVSSVTIKDCKDLGTTELNWVNNGSAVTSNIYVFVPIKVCYVWGTFTLGYATVTVQPTLGGN